MKLKSKVCMLSSAHGPFDDRIFFKEARTLSQNGYIVKFIVPAPEAQRVDGIQIIPVGKPVNRLERIIILPFKILIKSIKEKCDICHFHDPELIPIGLLLKIIGKKIIYDVHEDLAGQIQHKSWIKIKVIKKILAHLTTFIERFSSVFFDAIIAATPFIAGKFPQKKTHIVRNFVILELFEKAQPAKIERLNRHVVIYAGGLSRIRGIKELITAVDMIEDTELWLLGRWEDEDYFKECRDINGWKKTKYLGFVRMDRVYGYLKKADVGVVLLYPNPNYLMSWPVKAFEYMAAGLPMVMSNFPYWQDLFKDVSIFADPRCPSDIAEKIEKILTDEKIFKNFSRRGKELVNNIFNWERESNRLLKIYQFLQP